MERKIGEIFEYNGEWFQCVECDSCGKCSLRTTECGSGTKSDLADEVFGECSKIRRLDSKHAIFKKLEKVGEPYMTGNKLIQRYKIYPTTCCINVYGWYYQNLDVKSWTIDIEIKQRKEDMEEKNESAEEISIRIANEFKEKLEKHFKEYMDKIDTSNLKPFDIQKAREGKPVCTRDGRKARIICFDSTLENYPLVVLVGDYPYSYTAEGKFNKDSENSSDLMMSSEKKEGWVNVYKGSVCISVYPRIYKSREEAVSDNTAVNRIDTVKISWEE